MCPHANTFSGGSATAEGSIVSDSLVQSSIGLSILEDTTHISVPQLLLHLIIGLVWSGQVNLWFPRELFDTVFKIFMISFLFLIHKPYDTRSYSWPKIEQQVFLALYGSLIFLSLFWCNANYQLQYQKFYMFLLWPPLDFTNSLGVHTSNGKKDKYCWVFRITSTIRWQSDYARGRLSLALLENVEGTMMRSNFSRQ